MAYEQLRETCYYKTGRDGVVLEFIDQLYPNLFEDNENVNNSIFTRYSNIRVTLIDARKTEKGKAVYYNLSPNEILLLTYLLSDGIPSHFKKRVGAFNSLRSDEQLYIRQIVETFDTIDFSRFDRNMAYKNGVEGNSISFQKNINTEGNNLIVRKVFFSYEEAMRSSSKWKIIIEEGQGIKDTSKSGGLNIVKSGTYRAINKSYLMLQRNEIVVPINEAAKRVIYGQTMFYPLMKKAQVEFTKLKFKNNDFEGEKINEWNSKGKKEKKLNNKKNNKKGINKENNLPNNRDNKELKCELCGARIDERVRDYSYKFYKKPLCLKCQKKATKAS
jgi:hypothetical protein